MRQTTPLWHWDTRNSAKLVLQKILPEVVVPAPVDNKYLTVNYAKLIPLIVESIKELKVELDLLKRRE